MEYPSNKFNQPATPQEPKKEKIEKVTEGKLRKRGGVRKLRDAFLPEDVANVRSYIFSDILVPAIKKGIDDVFHTFLWGVGSARSSSKRGMEPSYREYYESKNSSQSSKKVSSVFSFDYIEVGNIGDAWATIEKLKECIARYGVVTVNDYYDAAGITDTSYTYQKYGWYNVDSAKPERTREGTYLVVMPRPLALN